MLVSPAVKFFMFIVFLFSNFISYKSLIPSFRFFYFQSHGEQLLASHLCHNYYVCHLGHSISDKLRRSMIKLTFSMTLLSNGDI